MIKWPFEPNFYSSNKDCSSLKLDCHVGSCLHGLFTSTEKKLQIALLLLVIVLNNHMIKYLPYVYSLCICY